MKYRNFKIREEEAVTPARLKAKINKNHRTLQYSYAVLYALMTAFVLFFLSMWAIYMAGGWDD